MNKKNIPVITDREKLYDKCENMEQLFDKYYLPLLDKHYSKTYKLQQEIKQLKEKVEQLELNRDKVIEKLKFIKNRKNQGCSQENINKMAIDLVNSWLKEVE